MTAINIYVHSKSLPL